MSSSDDQLKLYIRPKEHSQWSKYLKDFFSEHSEKKRSQEVMVFISIENFPIKIGTIVKDERAWHITSHVNPGESSLDTNKIILAQENLRQVVSNENKKIQSKDSSEIPPSLATPKPDQQKPLGKMMHFAIQHPYLTAGAIGFAVGLAVAALTIGTMGLGGVGVIAAVGAKVGLSAAASYGVGAAATGVAGGLLGVAGAAMYKFFKPKQSTGRNSIQTKTQGFTGDYSPPIRKDGRDSYPPAYISANESEPEETEGLNQENTPNESYGM